MVLQGVLLSTADLTFFAQDIRSKMTRECNSPQFLFIDQYFHPHERTVPTLDSKSLANFEALARCLQKTLSLP